eukprot:TRINITY_DN3201_c0_g1_i2.p1 TRINITY_DN3201_c0_g1~~TRINITY_DN3201_c0_g1_i2.p1  ORF type:complete len:396 (+),score=90.56 TRINITY_DN3201_c0_g1_i2:160-1347(+)
MYGFSNLNITNTSVSRRMSDRVCSMAFSNDNDELCVGLLTNEICILSLNDMSSYRLDSLSGQICDVCYSLDGQYLACCSNGCFVYIFHKINERWAILSTHRNSNDVYGITFSSSPDDYCIQFVGEARKFYRWDFLNSLAPEELSFSENGNWRVKTKENRSAIGSSSGYVHIINLDTFTVERRNKIHESRVRSVNWAKYNDWLCTCSYDKKVCIWDLENDDQRFLNFPNCVIQCQFFHRDQLFLTLTQNHSIDIFETKTLNLIQTIDLSIENDSFISFALSRDEKWLSVGRCCPEKNIQIYSLQIDFAINDDDLVKASKVNGSILANLTSVLNLNEIPINDVRSLISMGACMTFDEFLMVVDNCFDLSRLNEINGGNFSSWMDYLAENNNNDSDDD